MPWILPNCLLIAFISLDTAESLQDLPSVASWAFRFAMISRVLGPSQRTFARDPAVAIPKDAAAATEANWTGGVR